MKHSEGLVRVMSKLGFEADDCGVFFHRDGRVVGYHLAMEIERRWLPSSSGHRLSAESLKWIDAGVSKALELSTSDLDHVHKVLIDEWNEEREERLRREDAERPLGKLTAAVASEEPFASSKTWEALVAVLRDFDARLPKEWR